MSARYNRETRLSFDASKTDERIEELEIRRPAGESAGLRDDALRMAFEG